MNLVLEKSTISLLSGLFASSLQIFKAALSPADNLSDPTFMFLAILISSQFPTNYININSSVKIKKVFTTANFSDDFSHSSAQGIKPDNPCPATRISCKTGNRTICDGKRDGTGMEAE